MPRPAERIPDVLEAVAKVWKQKPDMRLGQLLVAVSGRTNADLFYMEDNALVDALNQFIQLHP